MVRWPVRSSQVQSGPGLVWTLQSSSPLPCTTTTTTITPGSRLTDTQDVLLPHQNTREDPRPRCPPLRPATLWRNLPGPQLGPQRSSKISQMKRIYRSLPLISLSLSYLLVRTFSLIIGLGGRYRLNVGNKRLVRDCKNINYFSHFST